jgi:hypothetical protein
MRKVVGSSGSRIKKLDRISPWVECREADVPKRYLDKRVYVIITKSKGEEMERVRNEE